MTGDPASEMRGPCVSAHWEHGVGGAAAACRAPEAAGPVKWRRARKRSGAAPGGNGGRREALGPGPHPEAAASTS